MTGVPLHGGVYLHTGCIPPHGWYTPTWGLYPHIGGIPPHMGVYPYMGAIPPHGGHTCTWRCALAWGAYPYMVEGAASSIRKIMPGTTPAHHTFPNTTISQAPPHQFHSALCRKTAVWSSHSSSKGCEADTDTCRFKSCEAHEAAAKSVQCCEADTTTCRFKSCEADEAAAKSEEAAAKDCPSNRNHAACYVLCRSKCPAVTLLPGIHLHREWLCSFTSRFAASSRAARTRSRQNMCAQSWTSKAYGQTALPCVSTHRGLPPHAPMTSWRRTFAPQHPPPTCGKRVPWGKSPPP
jgi:hypothetical protein